MNSINNANDIKQILESHETVILLTYRGSWCPFCRKYLSDFSKAFRSVDKSNKLIGISSESIEESQKLKEQLNLDFELVSDHNFIMNSLYQVKTGENRSGAYLQPSIFIFHKGVKVFEWIQNPSLFKNLGGAINRIPVKDVIKELNAST